jgi:hypothetical protein
VHVLSLAKRKGLRSDTRDEDVRMRSSAVTVSEPDFGDEKAPESVRAFIPFDAERQLEHGVRSTRAE